MDENVEAPAVPAGAAEDTPATLPPVSVGESAGTAIASIDPATAQAPPALRGIQQFSAQVIAAIADRLGATDSLASPGGRRAIAALIAPYPDESAQDSGHGGDDTAPDMLTTPSLGGAEITLRRNVLPWTLNDQVLPVAPARALPPNPADVARYTAFLLNTLARYNPGEVQLWSILRSGRGAEYIVRLAKVWRNPVVSQGDSRVPYACASLDCDLPERRIAVAAHIKCGQTNLANSAAVCCDDCQSADHRGPFRSCVATIHFGGSCTNCQYHGRAAQCSLRRHNTANAVRASRCLIGASSDRICMVPWRDLRSWEICALLCEGDAELARRRQ
ncbi:hypothetical protein C8A03DRAFT_37836, partial [Achaetomium macrosporum]